ncbi:preprotein translocase subunit SecG [Candidatus Profftella armatura]|uniref:Preprotein translocase subunit SecG n=1 Tax=Candidatus Profftella armatura TaxID=669502 RepID=S5R898_9PROT|nr:preprotein translocase subunit SecG [Candidatus Profftella armatura]AGS06805.1 preprotein translocase subunit SecG [Candidatus Profftella armatura]ALC95911.1 hypothetical protein AMC77_00565 [Candidatus Profftella armatura]QLK13716.1 preprotein translocase subunit SecG [Candidatus Profftella armatura]
MNIFFKILIFFQIISAFTIINLIIFQYKKNICFNRVTTTNPSVSNSFFGSIGSFNFIFKLIFIFSALFFLSTMCLTYLSKQKINNNTINHFYKQLNSSKISSTYSDNHNIKIKNNKK